MDACTCKPYNERAIGSSILNCPVHGVRAEETLTDVRLVCSRPINQDAIVVYKIRHWCTRRFDPSGLAIGVTFRSEYGGFGDVWTEYKRFDTLTMDWEHGVWVLDGIDEIRLREGLETLRADELKGRENIAQLRDMLDAFLDGTR